MSRSRGKSPSQRQLRVGEEIRHALVRVLARADFDDPALAGANITVTEVQVSPDLHSATAFVIPLGGSHMGEAVQGLNRAAGYLRGLLGREVHLRYTPRLGFEPDLSFERANEVERLLHSARVRRDLGPESSLSETREEEGDDGA